MDSRYRSNGARVYREPRRRLRKGDNVIAVIGMAGAGKTSLIRQFRTDRSVPQEHHRRGPDTEKVELYCCESERFGNFWLIDTPGFDGSSMTDFDVLEMVRRELDVDFSNGVTLAGIVYLYPITMMRFAKTSDRNKIMLSNLCGKDALQKTLLVTSCWNAVPSQLPADLAISREEKLRGTGAYWADLIAHNARVDRFDESQAAAYHIVDRVLHWKSYQDPGSFPHLRFEMAWQRKPSKDASVVAEEVERLLAERREYFEEKGEELRRDEDNQVTSQQEEHRRNVRQAEAEQDQSRRRQHSQVLDDISAEEREFDRLSTLLSGEEIKSRNRREAEAEELVYVNADVKDLDKQIEATDKSIAKTKARYQGGRPSKKRR